jgi:hypothetical protein
MHGGWVRLAGVHDHADLIYKQPGQLHCFVIQCVMLDGCIGRWLAARDHDVDLAEASLRQHALWRYKYVPNGRISEVHTNIHMVVCDDDDASISRAL